MRETMDPNFRPRSRSSSLATDQKKLKAGESQRVMQLPIAGAA